MTTSTAVAVSGPLATTIFAGPPGLKVLVGFLIGRVSTAAGQPEVDRTEVDAAPAGLAPDGLVGLSGQALDLLTGQVKAVLLPGLRPGDAPLLGASELLGGAAALDDDTFVLTMAP